MAPTTSTLEQMVAAAQQRRLQLEGLITDCDARILQANEQAALASKDRVKAAEDLGKVREFLDAYDLAKEQSKVVEPILSASQKLALMNNKPMVHSNGNGHAKRNRVNSPMETTLEIFKTEPEHTLTSHRLWELLQQRPGHEGTTLRNVYSRMHYLTHCASAPVECVTTGVYRLKQAASAAQAG